MGVTRTAEKQKELDDLQYGDLSEPKRKIHKAFLTLRNSNGSMEVKVTAKVMHVIVANLLKTDASSAGDAASRKKFGTIRLSNKGIKKKFVDMTGGVEALEVLGFERVTL